VLTLKDTSVLATDEHGNLVGLNEEGEDELENAIMTEDDKAKERQRKAKRAKMPVYTGIAIIVMVVIVLIVINRSGVSAVANRLRCWT